MKSNSEEWDDKKGGLHAATNERETGRSVQKLESRVVLCERTIEKMSSAH